MSGDGLIGQVGGALAETGARWGSSPAAAATTSPASSASPPIPPEPSPCWRQARSRRIDVGVANGRRFLCVASFGFDSDANRIANEARLVRGNLVYAYAALRALIAWRARHGSRSCSTAKSAIELRGLLRGGREQPRPIGGGMFIAPHADLDDGDVRRGH